MKLHRFVTWFFLVLAGIVVHVCKHQLQTAGTARHVWILDSSGILQLSSFERDVSCVFVCVWHYECTCLCLLFKALLKTAEATLFSNSCFSPSSSSELDLLQTEVTPRGLSVAPSLPPPQLPSPSEACSVRLSTLFGGASYSLDTVFQVFYHWACSVHVVKSHFHAMLWIYTC